MSYLSVPYTMPNLLQHRFVEAVVRSMVFHRREITGETLTDAEERDWILTTGFINRVESEYPEDTRRIWETLTSIQQYATTGG